MAGKVLKWIQSLGGLEKMKEINNVVFIFFFPMFICVEELFVKIVFHYKTLNIQVLLRIRLVDFCLGKTFYYTTTIIPVGLGEINNVWKAFNRTNGNKRLK